MVRSISRLLLVGALLWCLAGAAVFGVVTVVTPAEAARGYTYYCADGWHRGWMPGQGLGYTIAADVKCRTWYAGGRFGWWA